PPHTPHPPHPSHLPPSPPTPPPPHLHPSPTRRSSDLTAASNATRRPQLGAASAYVVATVAMPANAETRPAANAVLPSSRNASARDRKSTRLNSSHRTISYAVFCLKKKKEKME